MFKHHGWGLDARERVAQGGLSDQETLGVSEEADA